MPDNTVSVGSSGRTPHEHNPFRPIVVFGGGNVEHILEIASPVTVGEKHLVTATNMFGGGGVNYAARLLAAGFPVLPILAIGKDSAGHAIRASLLESVRRVHGVAGAEKIETFVEDSSFLIDEYRTTLSTIVVAGGKRTIFSEVSDDTALLASNFRRRITKVDELVHPAPGAVMVGHLKTVSKDGVRDEQNDPTSIAINHYAARFEGRCPIVVNFGKSQIEKGFEYWQTLIHKVSYLQLNVSEARQLFSTVVPGGRLQEIMGFLREQSITAIITLDKFGAVGNFKTGADGVMVVWPMIEDESKVADPTGTGDAFAAGVASVLSQKAEVSYPVFYEASRAGRLWAGYACTTVGGSAQSPSVSALADFEKTVTSKRAISVQPIGEAEPFIHLIDQANRA